MRNRKIGEGNMAQNKKKSTKKGAKAKVAAKNIKLSKNFLYTAIAIVLIAAILLAVLYFCVPDAFAKLFGINNGVLPSDLLEGDILEVNFMDVGQGDCNIIRLPDGKNMVIDAGGDRSSETAFKEVLKPLIDDMSITVFDYMILTHSDLDHVGYMDEILDYYEVKNVYRPAFRSKSEKVNEFALVETEAYDKFITKVNSEPDCNVFLNVDEDYVIEGENYEMNIFNVDKSKYTKKTSLSAKDLNAVSPFCELKYGDRSVFFTGDAEGKGGNGAEEEFVNKHITKNFDCDVLKAGHHGSATSSSLTLLNKIDPEYVVVSVGKDNKHKHPRNEFLTRIKEYKDVIPDGDYDGIAALYRTDENGRVRLRIGATGGLKFETQRNAA